MFGKAQPIHDSQRGRPRLGEQLGKAAVRFFVQEGEVPPALIDDAVARCAAHLVDLGMERTAALELAMVAWADLEGRKTRCYVDLAASSPHLVFLVDPVAGERRAIPVADLVRMLGPRAVG